MVLNNSKKDIKIMCLDAGINQEKLADMVGTTGQYVSRLIGNNRLVNKMYIEMLEALGYDIRLVYEKRDSAKS